MKNLTIEKRGKGRPKKNQAEAVVFDPKSVQIFKGSELKFNESIFKPMKTGTLMDELLSANKGLMPAVNMIICGGPGTGKSTVVLDMLARLAKTGKKVLFVSGEMDEIGHFKYCKRMPHFAAVPTLFLKNYTETVRETMEYVFDQGYDVIAIDSIAEVIEMYYELDGTFPNHEANPIDEANLRDLKKAVKKAPAKNNTVQSYLAILYDKQIF
jgi:predicted ATP-dependent serine protease